VCWSSTVLLPSARLTLQFFFLECWLYLSPFSNKVFSLAKKVILVLFITLGKNEMCFNGFRVYFVLILLVSYQGFYTLI
jgi:hypothetical protein